MLKKDNIGCCKLPSSDISLLVYSSSVHYRQQASHGWLHFSVKADVQPVVSKEPKNVNTSELL
jgi:hypothetical protein